MSKTIVKSVLGVVFLENKVVLVRRRDIPVWVLPGGAIDAGETPDEAIIREVKEETGYDAEIDYKMASYTFSNSFIDPVALYKLKVTNPEKKDFDRNEVKKVESFSPNTPPKGLVPIYIDWIKDALKNIEYVEKKITAFTPFTIVKMFLSQPIIGIRYICSRLGFHINT